MNIMMGFIITIDYNEHDDLYDQIFESPPHFNDVYFNCNFYFMKFS